MYEYYNEQYVFTTEASDADAKSEIFIRVYTGWAKKPYLFER